ncbi:hypothetical protein MA16_Dca014091 [Dendrobium catenatum]|uniref:Uncharacterized protein n=1 Tax=Dendrobium catenatum TaxID=906689 RepID=A0A2I0VS57_9ASPA|nr:hypothetical protein MA16_Dca014091 [Dendrobium catenatum]
MERAVRSILDNRFHLPFLRFLTFASGNPSISTCLLSCESLRRIRRIPMRSHFVPGDTIKLGQGFEDMEVLLQGQTPYEAKALENQPSYEKKVLEINLPVRDRLTFPKILKSDGRHIALTLLLPKKRADGRGMDDGPDQDPMIPSSWAIVVPGLLSQRR